MSHTDSFNRDGAAPAAACTNCRTPLAGRYCHACGQDSIPTETALASWRGQWQRLTRTLFTLLFRPGLLTREHLGGGRVRYIPPLTLFLNVVAIFFLLSVATDFRVQAFVRNDATRHLDHAAEKRAERAGISKEQFIERVERRFQSVYTLCMATISTLGYTLLLRLMFLRRWENWRGPFTFAVHYLSFILIELGILMAVIHVLSGHVSREVLHPASIVTSAGIAVTWLALASRRLFGDSAWVAVVKGIAIVALGFVIDNAMALAALMITFDIA